MYDNKYLYFNNLLYTYTTIGYDNFNVYDIQIMLITICEILSLNFSITLGKFLDYYFYDYKKTLPFIIDTSVPTLKNISILSIQQNKIDTTKLPNCVKDQCSNNIWSIQDTKHRLLEYIQFLHSKDQSILLNHILKKYNEYIENLPQKCDITRSRMAQTYPPTLNPTT